MVDVNSENSSQFESQMIKAEQIEIECIMKDDKNQDVQVQLSDREIIITNLKSQSIQRYNFNYKRLRLNWLFKKCSLQLSILENNKIGELMGFQLFYLAIDEEEFYINKQSSLADKDQQNEVTSSYYKENSIASMNSIMNMKSALQQIQEDRTDLPKQNLLVHLTTPDEKQMIKIQKFLKPRIIMKDLHTNFKAQKKLGKGSYASVYLVKPRSNKQLSLDTVSFAVKCFQKDRIGQEEQGYQSFYNEISIMKSLNHQNIMALYEVWESVNSYYTILEYCKFGNLLDRIIMQRRIKMNVGQKKDIPLNEQDVKRVMLQLLQAVQFLKQNKIMHRDIKPDNILLRSKDPIDIVLSDFGLSQRLNVPPNEYLFPKCGTPGYVAPEIINLKTDQIPAYDERCDMFSCGVIFYFCLILDPPFGSNSAKKVIKKNKKVEVNFNHYKVKKLPQNTQDLLKLMLEKDPDKRITVDEALQHSYFTQKDDTEEDYYVPEDSPPNINQKKERFNHIFNYRVQKFDPNNQSMCSNQFNLTDNQSINPNFSAKMVDINQVQYSLVMQSPSHFYQANEKQPSIEELLSEENDSELKFLMPQSQRNNNQASQGEFGPDNTPSISINTNTQISDTHTFQKFIQPQRQKESNTFLNTHTNNNTYNMGGKQHSKQGFDDSKLIFQSKIEESKQIVEISNLSAINNSFF